MESGLGIKYGRVRGGEEGRESQFHCLFFMQAAVIAYNILQLYDIQANLKK